MSFSYFLMYHTLNFTDVTCKAWIFCHPCERHSISLQEGDIGVFWTPQYRQKMETWKHYVISFNQSSTEFT